MFITQQIDELTKKLLAILPENVQNFEHEIQEKFKEIIQTALNKINLITREEFDIQIKVLTRTREKVEQLQKQVDTFTKDS